MPLKNCSDRKNPPSWQLRHMRLMRCFCFREFRHNIGAQITAKTDHRSKKMIPDDTKKQTP
jgi:hypothetical protein